MDLHDKVENDYVALTRLGESVVEAIIRRGLVEIWKNKHGETLHAYYMNGSNFDKMKLR